MIKINDGTLLKEVIGFCDVFNEEAIVKQYKSNGSEVELDYPLDGTVKSKLEILKQRGIDKNTGELSYEINDEIDELWNILIEKSIICLRFFDKREPFMENRKRQYVYGMDKLKEYHKNYIDFEGVLYGSDAYYRDHVFHVIRVRLLGIYLVLNANTHITENGNRLIDSLHFEGEVPGEIKKATEEDIKKISQELKKGDCLIVKKEDKLFKIHRDVNGDQTDAYVLVPPNTFSSEINILEKVSMWTIMALCHDLGYPLEKSKKVLSKTEKMMEAFISSPYVDRNLKFDGTQDSNNLDIITFASKKMKVIVRNEDSFLAKYNASIQDKYKFKYKLSLEDFSHGMISAIIIYKMLIYFIEADNNPDANYVFDNEDARQFYIRRDILRAISSHTCENIYHIDVATFPMILFVCDELQEWGRKSWKSMYRGVTNSAVQLTINSFNAKKIEYEEEIDMQNASGSQLVDNIERIIKKQYMLYLTTFRDGQYTARREFDFIKHIHIKVHEDYKSIEKIDVDFSINHGSQDNTFTLTIKNSGDTEAKGKKTKAATLTEAIKELLKPYCENKKYGVCRFIDDREAKK